MKRVLLSLTGGLAFACVLGQDVFQASAANMVFQAFVSDDNNNGGGGDPDPDPDPDFYACIIQVIQTGGFGTNIAKDVLDSEAAGGNAAQIRVTSLKPIPSTSSGYQLTFEAPTSFSSAPAGANTNVTFSAKMAGASDFNGVTFPLRDGSISATLPDAGLSITNLTGHLRGAKSDGPFPAGSYQAEAVVRCE